MRSLEAEWCERPRGETAAARAERRIIGLDGRQTREREHGQRRQQKARLVGSWARGLVDSGGSRSGGLVSGGGIGGSGEMHESGQRAPRTGQEDSEGRLRAWLGFAGAAEERVLVWGWWSWD